MIIAGFSFYIASINYPLIASLNFYQEQLAAIKARISGHAPIEENELGIGVCRDPKTELVDRCKKLGGALESLSPFYNLDGTLAGLENMPSYTFGCFPTASSDDFKKSCQTDVDCTGVCGWFKEDASSDVVGLRDFRGCSDYKKPFFQYKDDVRPNFICADHNTPEPKIPHRLDPTLD